MNPGGMDLKTAEIVSDFSARWAKATRRSHSMLDLYELETVQTYRSWLDVKELLEGLSEPISDLLAVPRQFRDFIEFFEKKLGTELDASLVWGTMACFLKLVSIQDRKRDKKILDAVPPMMSTLALKASAFNPYCGVPEGMTNNLTTLNMVREACFEMQVMFLAFFTNSIHYIHSSDPGKNDDNEAALRQIQRDFSKINQGLGDQFKAMKESVSSSFSMAVQPPPPRPIEVLPPPPRPSDVPRCLMLPPSRTIRLFDRVDVFQNLDKSLGPDVRGTSFRSVALHGIGGVGKSSVACSYMEARFKESVYDVGLWVSGEKPASLRQSFTDIALRLKLPGANPQHHEANFHLVHDWLQSTDRSWLVVYDNVESAEILMPYWPTSTNGRAIITTRNDSLAFEPASDGLEVTSWDDKTGSKFLLHLLKKNIDRQSAETVDDSAFALAKRLGGHALMISQMAGLIHRYKFPIEDFLAVYLRNPQTTHERDEFKAIWEASFASLSKDSKPLMGVISFLMPDNITPEIFANVEGRHFPADLSFCDNDFRLLEALAELFGLALVKKDEDTGIMSVHRMVQTQFKYFLSPEQRLRYFENAVALIFDLFPSEDIEVGQMYENWEMCNRHIQHVINLRDCFAEEQKLPGNFQVSFKLCELLLRSQRFLLESNEMKDFEETCRVNLMVVECLEPGAQKESYKATIISHQAQMAENLGDHETAIRLHKEDYKIQLAKQPRNLYFLSYTAGNLGYSYSSAGNQTEALKWFQTSREWWSNMPNRPLNILVNEARAYILLGDLETAEKLLDSFEKQARSDKSQGWAMNADGYFAIGVFDLHRKDFESAEQHFSAARQAWLKGDQTRLHPFYGACLYKLGVVYLSQGKVEAAINHLRDSVVITQADKDKRPAEHARVLFKLSEALSQDASDDSLDEAVKLRDEAEVYLRKQDPNTNNFSTDEAYDRFVTLDRR